MPWNSKAPQSDEPEDGGATLDRGENRSTARVTLLAAVGQAVLAQLAGEAAHWLAQSMEWLASHL
ncbi:hypothetical protein [Streptomyces sp. WAC06614]|uniref:hypothetical protein n=1 Tax=Streptomyces sp. WAC06614 TaxID=2487416 RepID=UPI000F7967F1|nr:hypothetical protein [Streptomyces sp. WAC06614]